MAADDDHTGAWRGASFTGADFTGAKFRDCDLRQVKITDSWLVDVSVSGLVGNFVVNDVDVTAFVEGELVRGIIDELTDARLERVCEQPPSPRHPVETRSVGHCLRVIMTEECEHRRYAVRDLAALEADLDGGAAHRDAPPPT